MKLTKYCSIVLSVFSDAISFNAHVNASKLHTILRSRPRRNELFASLRCVGNCDYNDIIILSRFHPGMASQTLTVGGRLRDQSHFGHAVTKIGHAVTKNWSRRDQKT